MGVLSGQFFDFVLSNYGAGKTKAIAYSGPCPDGLAAVKSAALRPGPRIYTFRPIG
jgi:hypothetical protein